MKSDPTTLLLIAVFLIVVAYLFCDTRDEDAMHFRDMECAHEVVEETRGAMTVREAYLWCTGEYP